jgi:hypothetical protein
VSTWASDSDLIDRFPEFKPAPQGIRQGSLDGAQAEIRECVWGPLLREAHLYLAAHKLAQHPLAQNLRKADGSDLYLPEYERLLSRVSEGIAVLL